MNRYVEAIKAGLPAFYGELHATEVAHQALTALLMKLRADPGAVEAIVARMPFVPRDEAGRVLSALCDYLAGDG